MNEIPVIRHGKPRRRRRGVPFRRHREYKGSGRLGWSVPGSRAGGGRERKALVAKAYDFIAKGSKSFAMASKLFDRDTRERSWLLYAWCRRCDDIADGQDFGGELKVESAPKSRIDGIRVLTARAFEGQPTADVAFDALGQVASETGITPQMADDVIAGFDLDAEGWRPRDEQDMMRYCYHVAGAVGVMMARVMGVPREADDVLDYACDLGMAFQLANIARDLDEDDAAGRCYVPEEWLVELDLPPGQHMKPCYRFRMTRISSRLIELMEVYEDNARIGASHLRFRQRWAVLSAAEIYGAIGRKVRGRGQLAWNSRVYVPGYEKLWHVSVAFAKALVNWPREPLAEPRWRRRDFASESAPTTPAENI